MAAQWLAAAEESPDEVLLPRGAPMKRNLMFVFLSATLFVATVGAQGNIEHTSQTEFNNAAVSTSPVAWVYVSSTAKGSSVHQIEAFSAAANGKLTAVAGSPFQEDVTNIAVNGKYLFAVNSNGFYIDSYLIEPTGALRYATYTNAAEAGDCNTLGQIFLDHTGATLYGTNFNGDGCANNTYESFGVNKATGGLSDLGNSTGNDWLYLPASFIGNNQYAYSASCIGDMYWGIFVFQRSSNGLLSESPTAIARPPTPPTGYFYCPSQAAADPSDHVAISMQPVNQLDFSPDKPAQLATFTADAQGNLRSTSTPANMPVTSVAAVTDLNMSPSGRLLAVGGTGGLQIFHYNGASPITHYTGLLTTDEIDQFFWDNQNHMYAISQTSGKLFVFTVTPTSYSQSPGSPYTISSPISIIVQPLPRY